MVTSIPFLLGEVRGQFEFRLCAKCSLLILQLQLASESVISTGDNPF